MANLHFLSLEASDSATPRERSAIPCEFHSIPLMSWVEMNLASAFACNFWFKNSTKLSSVLHNTQITSSLHNLWNHPLFHDFSVQIQFVKNTPPKTCGGLITNYFLGVWTKAWSIALKFRNYQLIETYRRDRCDYTSSKSRSMLKTRELSPVCNGDNSKLIILLRTISINLSVIGVFGCDEPISGIIFTISSSHSQ